MLAASAAITLADHRLPTTTADQPGVASASPALPPRPAVAPVDAACDALAALAADLIEAIAGRTPTFTLRVAAWGEARSRDALATMLEPRVPAQVPGGSPAAPPTPAQASTSASHPDVDPAASSSETAAPAPAAESPRPPDPTRPTAELVLARTGSDTGYLRLATPWVEAELRRENEQTLLILPRHRLVFAGTGARPAGPDRLDPGDLAHRLITMETALIGPWTALGAGASRALLARWLEPHIRPAPEETGKAAGILRCRIGKDLDLAITEPPQHATPPIAGQGNPKTEAVSPANPTADRDLTPRLWLAIASSAPAVNEFRALTVSLISSAPAPAPIGDGEWRTETVDRALLERMVVRGLRRALSVQFPGPQVADPLPGLRVPHGELRYHEGQLLVLLAGSPSDLGAAHGLLLGPAVRRTLDSTFYLVGLVETIERGRWFPQVLEEAWQRLSPHIPATHRLEIAALASTVPDVPQHDLELANVFPEYFHCSGFAVFGRATASGTLYHGRVLDYMTQIGLQQAAVTFVVSPERGHAFVNAGYAGFIGCVTGMNERQISVGEMGGGGRFQWDGVPMATLMRRALEECGTLAEVQHLWVSHPLTCEYYYVFADAKIPSAVGVRAVPGTVEFLQPGEDHPRLGEGMVDTVLLSAGSRLKTLKQRVREAHGTLDASAAMRLMDRPVAMRSNLHNVLMVPGEGLLYRAEAGAGHPGCDRPYVRYDLRELWPEAARLR